jgi:hypothetical protein
VDCLFADLGFDPRYGCQIFAADCLLARPCRLDPHSALIVFQPATIGITRYRAGGRVSRAGVRQLVERLLEFYPADHDVVIYEAASYPVVGPRMEHIPLTRLPKAMLTPISTLFVPPFGRD